MELLGLFPVPVGIIKLDRGLTVTEKKCFNRHSKIIRHNSYNLTSTNNHVLEDPDLQSIKDFCLKGVHEFIKNSNPPKHKLDFYITQSWLNYTEHMQSHHRHSHPNSIISGVFYLNADKNNDRIYFLNSSVPTLKYTAESFTMFNSEEWYVSVETNMLVLFPSTLHHYVSVNRQPYRRESLSFNTFLKGNLGEPDNLTELIL
jgi:uncharacterized protein (TIGR02466 family)